MTEKELKIAEIKMNIYAIQGMADVVKHIVKKDDKPGQHCVERWQAGVNAYAEAVLKKLEEIKGDK